MNAARENSLQCLEYAPLYFCHCGGIIPQSIPRAKAWPPSRIVREDNAPHGAEFWRPIILHVNMLMKRNFMTELLQVYKCEVCGNMVEVIHAGDGELSCCGQPMKYMQPGTTDGATEKHVPVIEKWKKGYHIKVGSARHPMEDKHHVEWIELITPGASIKRYLSPDDEPEAFFDEVDANDVTVREYCNLHGLWQSKN